MPPGSGRALGLALLLWGTGCAEGVQGATAGMTSFTGRGSATGSGGISSGSSATGGTLGPGSSGTATTTGASTTGGPTCGDGTIDPGEVCDGNDLAGETCVTQGFDQGTLVCNATCSGFNTSGCSNSCLGSWEDCFYDSDCCSGFCDWIDFTCW